MKLEDICPGNRGYGEFMTHFSGIQAGSDTGSLHQDRFRWLFYMGGSDRIRLVRGLDSR